MKELALCAILCAAGALAAAPGPEYPPLLSAVRKGDVEAARRALEAGADVNAKDIHGETPLDHARRKGQEEVAALLAKHGARPGKAASE